MPLVTKIFEAGSINRVDIKLRSQSSSRTIGVPDPGPVVGGSLDVLFVMFSFGVCGAGDFRCPKF